MFSKSFLLLLWGLHIAVISFLYCMASSLCHIGCVMLTLILFIGGQTLGSVVFLVSSLGIPAIANWLMDRLYLLKRVFQDFITS